MQLVFRREKLVNACGAMACSELGSRLGDDLSKLVQEAGDASEDFLAFPVSIHSLRRIRSQLSDGIGGLFVKGEAAVPAGACRAHRAANDFLLHR